MLKVISSNIRFDNPNDGDNIWKNRLPLLAGIFNKERPHILGTQEGWQSQLNELHKEISHLKMVDDHRDWIDDRMYPTLFIDINELQISDSGDIWLSETPYVAASKSFDSAFPRLCTWANVTHKKSSKKFTVVNVHLDHLQSNTRSKQIQVLIAEISKIMWSKDIILMGDFNESPFEDVRAHLNNSDFDLKDPWMDLERDEETSHHSFKGLRDDGARIDWILISKLFKANTIELYKEESNGVYPSDHFPVILSLKID